MHWNWEAHRLHQMHRNASAFGEWAPPADRSATESVGAPPPPPPAQARRGSFQRHTHNLLTHNLLRHNSHTSPIYSVNAGGDGMECCGFDCRKASQWGLAFLWTYGLDDLWHLECSGALGVLPGADIYGDDATLADPGWPWQRQQPRQCGDHGPGRR